MEAPTPFARLLQSRGFTARVPLIQCLTAHGIYVSPQTAADWIRGRSHPRDEWRIKVAEAIGVPFETLARACGGEDVA